MEDKKILVGRKRAGSYTINHTDNSGVNRKYEFNGSIGKKIETKSLPEGVVLWLTQQTSCFSTGELVMMNNEDEFVKELKEEIPSLEEVEKQTMTREEIEALLKGHHAKVKKELDKVELDGEKRFIVQVAKELCESGEFDSVTKREAVANMIGSEAEILFAKED